ncbi:hypothetical protein [Burkholderia sp. Bp9090]|uniref:hypothetical protein n=1 Tax=Burkholderia sp. Bp9090 TaxID=2184567 RepID=UPI001639EE7B|nr:hypothetical protein [Burkholderia sp. Bp9090]
MPTLKIWGTAQRIHGDSCGLRFFSVQIVSGTQHYRPESSGRIAEQVIDLIYFL